MLDEAQIDALYRHRERALYNVAVRWTWNRAEAQELVQEAFLRLWRSRQRVKAEGASAYLFRTLLNLAQTHARRRERWDRVRRRFPFAMPPAPAMPDQALDEDGLRHAILDLPERQRAVLLLCEFSDLRQREIAAILGVPPGTVASRRNAAIERLRKRLAQTDELETPGEVDPAGDRDGKG